MGVHIELIFYVFQMGQCEIKDDGAEIFQLMMETEIYIHGIQQLRPGGILK